MPVSLPLPVQNLIIPFRNWKADLMATSPTLIYAKDSHHHVPGAPFTNIFHNVRLKLQSLNTLELYIWSGKGYISKFS